ncbi:MAG: hypothetical protein ACI4EJ_05190 [Bacteroides sp.]|nr:hypothetical protein [Clostridia bacterium]
MNENYVIDGNAVYEIDADCTKMPDVKKEKCSWKIETQMIPEEDEGEEKVSVFF